ncbi:putative retrotransposon hot spot protein (RHS) [Trypanosoma cruzi]|uniref:Putative retrotransposon hot spot protein (RHS) n=1 Tax=Trypanosoma cruzi TaxID=5693 RepID=A0A2V2WF77_TRYCR|nr:putative retrotransposon hot spot protein (RHS) [Trypanosoma cruzi]
MIFLRWNLTAEAFCAPIGMSYWRIFWTPRSISRDAGVLNEMQASGHYARIEKTVRDEMDLEEVVRRLHEKGVNNLLGWSLAAEEVKACARDNNKNTLDAALHEARNPNDVERTGIPGGLYESVHNARWHHVVEVPDGEGTGTGIGMEVREGNHRSHGRTRRLATLSKRMTLWSNPAQSVSS